jgi:hypothetical protein
MDAIWKININLFVAAHQSLEENVSDYDKETYSQFSIFLQTLQDKKFDALTAEDSTELHTYIDFLIYKYLLKYFAANCLQWAYTVHLVDSSTIIKKIKEGDALTAQRLEALESTQKAQFAEIEERLSALESKYLTISAAPSEMLARLLQI